ncbi:MAG TPA: hypothetical protein VFZ64_07090 [Nocardioidaceae bacterium]
MRLLGHTTAAALSLVLGLVTGTVSVLLHSSLPGLVLGVGTTLVVLWTLRLWLPRAVLAFAAGWLGAFLVALAGRGEGDYVISSDLHGWLITGSGLVILVTGIWWGRGPAVQHDSGYVGDAT